MLGHTQECWRICVVQVRLGRQPGGVASPFTGGLSQGLDQRSLARGVPRPSHGPSARLTGLSVRCRLSHRRSCVQEGRRRSGRGTRPALGTAGQSFIPSQMAPSLGATEHASKTLAFSLALAGPFGEQNVLPSGSPKSPTNPGGHLSPSNFRPRCPCRRAFSARVGGEVCRLRPPAQPGPHTRN